MSRWLWALLGGAVLVAIAAFFWTASNQTNVTPPVSPGRTAVAPAPVPAPPAPPPVVQETAPSPPPAPAPPTAQEAAAPPAPAPAPTPPPAPSPAPAAGQQAAAPPAPPPPSETPSTPPAAEAPLPPPAPGREASEVQGVYAPKSLEQLVGTWAYSAEDCERLFQRRGGGWAYRQPVDKFAQAAIVESTKKILLPSATCRIEGASEVGRCAQGERRLRGLD